MKRKFTFLIAAAVMLLAMMASTTIMWGQTGDVETFTFSELGFENAADVTTVTGNNVTLTFDKGEGTNAPKYYSSGSAVRMYANNTLVVALNGSGTITAIDFTFVSSSYQGSLQNWAGSETSVSFTNTSSSQARIQVITVTYSNGGSTKDPCDLALTNAPVELTFDLYNNGEDQVISYTTSSTGAISVVVSNYIDTDIDEVAKTITITPVAVTNGVQTITVNQDADDNYYAGSTTFTVTITDSTPFAGGDVTFDATLDKGTSPLVKNGVTFACSNGVLNNGSEYRLYKNSVTTFSVGNGSSITQISFTCQSSNPAGGFADQDGWTTEGNNGTWTGNAGSVSFTASGAQVRATEIVVTVAAPGTDPYITAENVGLAYNATSGVIEYTINNPAQGGNLTAAVTDGNWITLGTVGATVPFTCSANTTAIERTAKVTLTYTYGNNQTATKDVTVTQAGNPDVTMTIAEVRAQGTGNVVTQGVVTSITGSSNKTAYIQDESAAIVVYGNFTATVGDEIKVSGSLSNYNGLLEITSPQVTVLSSNNPILPQLMTIAEVVASTNQGWYVRIEEATVTNIDGQNTTIAQGENTIVVRGISGVEYAENDILSLNGNIGYYNGNQIANPQNVEVQHPTVPTITITNTTINVPFEGEVGTIAVTYTNFEDIEPTPQFFAEDGVTPATYGWVTITFDQENNAVYTINPNEGAARTAYFKVYEESEGIYSNLVTINQAAYVAPTYAELPFTFDGGRANIEETEGLYQEGLGSDYNNSPKLKFDSAGDWLLLQFNERPGKLTFKIKGNTFSGGTFTVQTSEDGETYTDLATYTELGAAQVEEFDNLGENVRFIKWIYTEKVNGNVALGAITLEEYVASITVDPDVVNEDADEHDGTLDLTYENMTITSMDDFGIQYYDAEGEEAETPDWIEVLVAEQDPAIGEGYVVSYYMIENEGNARTAYFKVFAMGDEDFIYSNLVTINQAAYIPPFEPATYKLANSIESGKAYIITSEVYDDMVYAMGTQGNNNRAAVSVGINDATITVDTDNVYEFVIEGPDDGGLYTIYDARTPGYLYAASSSSNYLRTQTVNDDNGRWSITFNAEGYAEIQATESSNRNVMQYNGGSSLFSCYSSASQSPVYLYVKNEGTQITELTAGWNWFSTYVVVEDPEEMLTTVAESLGDEWAIWAVDDYINSDDMGDLTEMYNEQMYAIYVDEDVTVSIEGLPTDPADYPITIEPGWNWIGFPCSETVSLEDALADFEAVDGDMIWASEEFSSYADGEWGDMGDLEELVPGQGYKFFSASDETRTLVFSTGAKKTKKAFIGK